MDGFGAFKAAFGIRGLLRYLANKNIDELNNLRGYVDEIKLWILITFYSNNLDYLIDSIPEDILKDVFLMKSFKIGTYNDARDISYGRGIVTDSIEPYKKQFKYIRDALCHRRFIFKNGLISVHIHDYMAVFDLKWLDALTFVALSNDSFSLEKGKSDVSILCIAFPKNYDINEFKELLNQKIFFYKVTSLTGNKETMKNAVDYPGLQEKDYTFDFVFNDAIRLIQEKKLNYFINPMEQLRKYLKEIEDYYNKKIKLELMPIDINEDIFSDEDFINLSFHDKLNYLVAKIALEDRVRYNSYIALKLIDFLGEIEKGKFSKKVLFALRDAEDFLLKVYTNICFNNIEKRSFNYEELASYGVNARFVRAKDVYNSYLKELNKSLRDLVNYNGEKINKKFVLKEMRFYTKMLEDVIDNEIYKDFFVNIRNAVVHDQIEFMGDQIRFYITGRNIFLYYFSKKKKCWEKKEFCNTKPIWEMVINKKDLIMMLDDLFKREGIDLDNGRGNRRL